MPDVVPQASQFRDGDPLQRMRVYRLASELIKESWGDAEILTHDRTTERVAGQLYAAVGSIAANLGEGMLMAIIPRERNRRIRPLKR